MLSRNPPPPRYSPSSSSLLRPSSSPPFFLQVQAKSLTPPHRVSTGPSSPLLKIAKLGKNTLNSATSWLGSHTRTHTHAFLPPLSFPELPVVGRTLVLLLRPLSPIALPLLFYLAVVVFSLEAEALLLSSSSQPPPPRKRRRPPGKKRREGGRRG